VGLGPICQGESCCLNLQVTGGELLPLGDAASGGERNTTVSTFGLDKYEVTVGRFRRFVQGYDAWRATGNPPAGASTHPLIPGSGWQESWNASLPNSAAELSSALQCGSLATWTVSAASNEQRPINCLNWYMSFAFCHWDGGRLPTEVEWEYAAAGGSENRTYAWGNSPVPDDSDATYAVYNCLPAAGECVVADLLPVGSKPLGQARFGHRDIAGSLWEWLIDWHTPSYPATVPANYAKIDMGTHRIFRSGSWQGGAQYLPAAYRLAQSPQIFADDYGARCARNR
jgi:formylglycine-generating enzyme required for sulfatase activity